jgi:hypothetical protein
VLLGRVHEVWLGVDPATTERCDEDICSRVEVRHGVFGREVRYIPPSAIAGVTETAVILNVDARTVNATIWHQKPHWIPVRKTVFDAGDEAQPWGVRPSRRRS